LKNFDEHIEHDKRGSKWQNDVNNVAVDGYKLVETTENGKLHFYRISFSDNFKQKEKDYNKDGYKKYIQKCIEEILTKNEYYSRKIVNKDEIKMNLLYLIDI
jgi:hypothetical protein